ncbi:SDR family NAD(P)-dependent oxidoreductase [Gemmatimonas groenlandica]|uniref:SDR family NAD(P)-dependent oxidoreductase n=2 Tax=Gemmatimonas groenlandica TaxID=2732249 RepID=A0A6M4IVY8_9BACT|nr:SDR family NAD(P)-dependent oxidoreductase [Gemmatimonas groenlandica]
MTLRGRTAVITGAGSGIGRAIASSLAQRGCHLALADVNTEGLAETVSLLPVSGLRVTQHQLDVADRAQVAAFPAIVREAHGGADLLVNNAGVALGGTFEMVSEADFDWLFNINFHGVVSMTRAFLPLLRASTEARLVNISSIFGIVAPAEQVAYAASKFAVRGFSEALRHELDGTTVGVTVVHPGGVRTNIAERARAPEGVDDTEAAQRRAAFKKFLRMPPAKAGEIIVRGIEQRRKRVLVGSDAVGLSLLARLAPVSYWSIMAKGLPK